MSSQKLHPYATPTVLAHVRGDSRSRSRRSLTPNGRALASSARLMNSIEGDLGAEDDPRLAIFKDLYAKSEARLASLFEEQDKDQDVAGGQPEDAGNGAEDKPSDDSTQVSGGTKRKRPIDEDDYGDDSDGEDTLESPNVSPLKAKSTKSLAHQALTSASMLRTWSQSSNTGSIKGGSVAGKTTEEMRKNLEAEQRATEDAAKRTNQTLFHTLENDRDAMLEQKKLEELERKVDAELGDGTNANATSGTSHHGTLSQTNLGASSLTLKNLIKRIDDQRQLVEATDSELRSLMSEVRKNRSKWASEDKVGQEDLYESLEKVLSELKGHTEHSTHFLNKVNKKEAPDYHTIIKHPMDLGTMTKKLKNLQYKSKKEYTDDLMLIWSNCLKYNANPDHYMRKHALYMRKQTERLVPLIPDITIRDRAEVEAEERRQQQSLTGVDGEEDSDDEPIISSRGRKAPSKKAKKGTTARKAPAGTQEATPNADGQANSMAPGLDLGRDEATRPDSETHAEGSQTPPHGSATPTGLNGTLLPGTQGDNMDLDNESMANGIAPSIPDINDEPEYEDAEHKMWKSVTQKDRAIVTSERHQLFKDDGLNADAPALLRSRAGMRSWLRKQKQGATDAAINGINTDSEGNDQDAQPKGETLAEGMEGEEERVLPDYYDPLGAIPDAPSQNLWIEDSEGQLVDPTSEACLRELPQGQFVAPQSSLRKRIEENLHQVQRTRKITAKIGVVKQMALQSQLYQGQFQKTEIVPLLEQDIEPHVLSDDAPIIAPSVSRAALQRTTAKLLMHAGFEEFQPSALEAFTDMAGDYFKKIAGDLVEFSEGGLCPVSQPTSEKPIWKQRFTVEDRILHALDLNGADLEALDNYVNEDIDRAGTRLTTTHERMKAHLADLLRPALQDAGPDGSGAFNDDSEQFVSGDFAEELGDDFFGFKELGLGAEFGDASMSVPLHLLQKSMYNANQAQNISTGASAAPSSLPELQAYPPVSVENVNEQIGLVQEFFLKKLHANNDKPLPEDDQIPSKLRPKPRLPATGKIVSPMKKVVKEPGPGKGHPRKKMKLNEDAAKIGEGEVGAGGDIATNNGEAGATDASGVLGDPIKQPALVNGASVPSKPGNSTPATGDGTLTNGILPSQNGVSESVGDEAATPPTKLGENGKGKDLNGDSLPSPESLGAL